MTITQVLAVAPVTDLDRSAAWYARLLDLPEAGRPMPSLAEFQVTDTGWIQVFVDPERAGRSAINVAVDDVDATRERLATAGFDVSGEAEASRGVRLLPVTDPDGNVVTVIGDVRHG